MNPCILLQGPLTYQDYLISHYDPSVTLFSSWKEDGTNKFKNKLELTKPTNPGFGNSNLQFYGSRAGCLKAKELGFDYVLKVRSDLIISNYELLLKTIDKENISTLAYHNYDGGYIVDYVLGGPIDLMSSIWDHDTSNDHTFSERSLMNRIAHHSNKVTKFNYLIPLMNDLKIICYSLKWKKDLVEDFLQDKLFTYDKNI